METEISPQTSWQNEGICSRYAEDKLNDCALRSIYMAIVRRSFGYGKKYTDRISQEELAKASEIKEQGLGEDYAEYFENEFVKVIYSTSYIDGGGSESYAYAPAYPKGYGKLYFEDDVQKSSYSGSKHSEPEKKNREDYKF